MPTKAKTCCGMRFDFSGFTIQPNSLQEKNKVAVFGTMISGHGLAKPIFQKCKAVS